MAALLQRQSNEAGTPPPREIQIDCDWTERTRNAYFQLLTALKREPFLQGKILSATIRLHQVKYVQRSGIPPADRGRVCFFLLDAPSGNPGDERAALCVCALFL